MLYHHFRNMKMSFANVELIELDTANKRVKFAVYIHAYATDVQIKSFCYNQVMYVIHHYLIPEGWMDNSSAWMVDVSPINFNQL